MAHLFASWISVVLCLHLAWEIAQLPLYRIANNDRAWAIVHCTLGDGLIAAASFAVAALVLRDRDWPARRPALGLIVVVAVALPYTAFSELRNLQAGNWAYAEAMPRVMGVGLSPLLQWLIVPAAAGRIVRRMVRKTVGVIVVR